MLAARDEAAAEGDPEDATRPEREADHRQADGGNGEEDDAGLVHFTERSVTMAASKLA